MADTRITAGRIRRALYQISDAWDDTLEPARRIIESHALTPPTNPPLPISADVLDKRRTAHIRLAYWARLVIQGQKLHLLAGVDVAALAAFLIIHCDWLADHPSSAAAVRDLEDSATDLGAIAADNAPHRFNVGHCPTVACVGVLRVVLRADDDLLPSALTCTVNPEHTWPAGAWRVLDRIINGGPVRHEGAARRLVAVLART